MPFYIHWSDDNRTYIVEDHPQPDEHESLIIPYETESAAYDAAEESLDEYMPDDKKEGE